MKRLGKGILLCAAFVLGALAATLLLLCQRGGGTGSLEDVVFEDMNSDGNADVVYIYKFGQISGTQVDRDFDGKMDEEFSHRRGVVVTGAADNDFDGEMDAWMSYSNGILSGVKVDTDFNGEPNMEEIYRHGVLSEERWYSEAPQREVRRVVYESGVPQRELIDTDGDGTFDKALLYTQAGRIRQELTDRAGAKQEHDALASPR